MPFRKGQIRRSESFPGIGHFLRKDGQMIIEGNVERLTRLLLRRAWEFQDPPDRLQIPVIADLGIEKTSDDVKRACESAEASTVRVSSTTIERLIPAHVANERRSENKLGRISRKGRLSDGVRQGGPQRRLSLRLSSRRGSFSEPRVSCGSGALEKGFGSLRPRSKARPVVLLERPRV